MPLQYQLITLGPNADLFDHRIRQELFDGFRDLDLDPASDLAILGANQRSQLNAKCSILGLWYGGDSPFVGEVEHIEALESLLAMGVAPLPLVESLEVFTKKIPKSLQSINGIAWDDARLIGDILKAFGLTPSFARLSSATSGAIRRGSPGNSPTPCSIAVIRSF